MFVFMVCLQAQACTSEQCRAYARQHLDPNRVSAEADLCRPCTCGGTRQCERTERTAARLRFMNDSHGRRGRSAGRRHAAGSESVRYAFA